MLIWRSTCFDTSTQNVRHGQFTRSARSTLVLTSSIQQSNVDSIAVMIFQQVAAHLSMAADSCFFIYTDLTCIPTPQCQWCLFACMLCFCSAVVYTMHNSVAGLHSRLIFKRPEIVKCLFSSRYNRYTSTFHLCRMSLMTRLFRPG